jgi:hypothetical protein
MAQKEVIYQGLLDLTVSVDDLSVNSPNYFRITKLPGEFTSGVNVFRFKGNPALFVEGSYIYIEILDSNGNPIYYESNLDLESASQDAIVSVYVNQDTAPGPGYIIICGIANQTAAGKKLNTSEINVRWIGNIFIDPSKPNESEIVFSSLPDVNIVGGVGAYTNFGYPGGTKYVTASLTNLEYYSYNQAPVIATSSLSNVGFDENALAAKIQFSYSNLTSKNPAPFGNVSQTAFTSSVNAIISSGIITLTDPVKFPVDNNNSIYLLSSAKITSASILYEQSSSLPPGITENSYNIANAFFSNLEPQAGTIAKIRSYYRSSGVGEYILSNETDITDLSSEFGFTPATVTASFAIPTVHRNDRLDFKFEFISPTGQVSKQYVESLNNLFLGGNTYIAGDDNLLTGSLYVAGATGTGVHISGKASSAMVRSIGYTGFANAIAGTGGAGFVLYSGSIQPLLGSSETYSGVGLEMVANSQSYFKYTTSGSGLLDIRTSNFFLGNASANISSSNGALSITSPRFIVNAQGQVTASSILVQRTVASTPQIMIDTDKAILDATNIGRTLFATRNEYSYSDSAVHGTVYFPSDSGSLDFVFQGLVNEFRYVVSYQVKHDVSVPVGVLDRPTMRFRLYYATSGSGNYYDNWTEIASQTQVTTRATTASYTADYQITGRTIDLLSLDAVHQGKLLRGQIDFNIANAGGGTYTASFKNITVTGMRGLATAYQELQAAGPVA